MFNFFKKKEITIINKGELGIILNQIIDILKENEYFSQANSVEKSLKSLVEDDIINFIKSLNTLEYWGGAGAVWEVGLPLQVERKFQKCIVDFVEQLNKSGIKIRAAIQIAKLFKSELRK